MTNARLVGILLAGGLIGHLVAAQINGGSFTAFWHHTAGFFLIAIVTGVPILGLTRMFWRGHMNRALVIFGLVQLLLGAWIAFAEWQKR